MQAILMSYLVLALGNVAYTYGYSENGYRENISVTASGEKLLSNVASAALPVPKKFFFKPFTIGLKTATSKCVLVRINDKTSPKLIGKRGFDMSPQAVYLLTGKRSATWSSKVSLCDVEKEK